MYGLKYKGQTIYVIYSLTSPHVSPLTEAWDCEASICKAFAIGKTEAKAVVQLHKGMDPKIRDMLERAVHDYGMRSFIYHDVISKECFSRGFCSAFSGLEDWGSQLTNSATADDPLVS